MQKNCIILTKWCRNAHIIHIINANKTSVEDEITMFTESTMDATRRMLLKRNEFDSDEELFPFEDLDTLTKECTKENIRPYLVTKPPRQESMESLLNNPSILRARKRRRWFLNSGHHPRLPLLVLSKYYTYIMSLKL